MLGKILHGDALEELKKLPDDSVDCCMSSPPYWALRDYGIKGHVWDGNPDCRHEWETEIITKQRGTAAGTNAQVGNQKNEVCGTEIKQGSFCSKCGAWKGALGLEPTFDLFIKHLCDIYDEVKRVLKPTGTCWVNLGDTYASASGGRVGATATVGATKAGVQGRGVTDEITEKSLCCIPFRFAIEMITRDTMDIYKLEEGFINSNIHIITENNALRRQGEREGIQSQVPEGVAQEESQTLSGENEKVATGKQGQDEGLQQDILLGKQGEGDNQVHEGECQEAQKTEMGSPETLRRKSASLPMLRGVAYSLFDNRPYIWERKSTSQGDSEVWDNLRVAQKGEIPKGIQDSLYELQLGNGKVRNVPPSRGRNFKIRKRGIPEELQKYFRLIKKERWRLRNTIIWHKKNCMPSSAKDRFTVDFEYLFFFTKSKKYYFDRQTEPLSDPERLKRRQYDPNNLKRKFNYGEDKRIGTCNPKTIEESNKKTLESGGRNKRCIWTINPKPFAEAHFAVYPEELCETPIKAGCPEFVCKKCGKPREKIYERGKLVPDSAEYKPRGRRHGTLINPGMTARGSEKPTPNHHYEYDFQGYTDCKCNVTFEPGVVLDPFLGSGTTALVAEKLGRRWIGIELNEEYIKIAEKRLEPYRNQAQLTEVLG